MKPHEITNADKMHSCYGPGPDGRTCGECAMLSEIRYNRNYFKCEAYRISRSAATDWRKKWPACGRFQEAARG